MIDSELIGKTSMQLLDHMETDSKIDGGKIIAVGVVCVVENADGDATFTRCWCSDTEYYKQLGLFHTAIEVVEDGLMPEEDEDADG